MMMMMMMMMMWSSTAPKSASRRCAQCACEISQRERLLLGPSLETTSSVTMQHFCQMYGLLPQQIRVLDRSVECIVRDRAVSRAETQAYVTAVERLQAFICKYQKGVRLEVYGAVLSGCALKDAEVSAHVYGDRSAPALLVQVLRILLRHGAPEFVNVESDFRGQGRVTVYEACSGCGVLLVTGREREVKTSQLLHFYFSIDCRAASLALMLRCWAKICQLDKPDSGTLPEQAFDVLVIYFLQQIVPPVLPVIQPSHIMEQKPVTWHSANFSSVGMLWLQLLKFYCKQFNFASVVVSLNHHQPLLRTEKGWLDLRLAIEDPVCENRNLAQTMQRSSTIDLFWFNLAKAYDYFAVLSKPRVCQSKFSWIIEQKQGREHLITAVTEKNAGSERKECEVKLVESAAISLCGKQGGCDDCNMTGVGVLKTTGVGVTVSDGQILQRFEEKEEKVEDSFSYELYCGYFITGMLPKVKICQECKKEGHVISKCPELMKSSLILPDSTPQHVDLVDQVITLVLKDFSPTEEDLINRSELMENLTNCIHQVYPDADVEVYGSTMSGFDLFSSDLDISVNFKPDFKRGVDASRRMECMAKILQMAQEFSNVRVIKAARVPIVKFVHNATGLQGDISVDNFLGLYNSRLLQCYSSIDERVKILGMAVKVMARICSICDASVGSLSSYAYILMMLHYLQQCVPPVIPALQELYPESAKPEPESQVVDGCNVWFFDDLERLWEVWPGYGQNKQSVGELWLGFLRYYAMQFDWGGSVVTISQLEPLTKFERGWNHRKTLTIQDPFELDRNLGSHLSSWANNCIAHTFRRGAVHFCTPTDQPLMDASDYFFNVYYLTGGYNQTSYFCPACDAWGHVFKDCKEKTFERTISACRKQEEQQQKQKQKQQQQQKQQKQAKLTTSGAANIDVLSFGASNVGRTDAPHSNNTGSAGSEKTISEKGLSREVPKEILKENMKRKKRKKKEEKEEEKEEGARFVRD